MAHGPDTEKLLSRFSIVTTVLDISNLNITSLPELSPGLKALYCYHTPLTSLPDLPSGLEILFCRDTQLTSLPVLPPSLVNLICSNTQLSSLPVLPFGICYLDCSNTQITTLPNLPSGLKFMDCSNMPITTLPDLPVSLTMIICENSPLILQRNENESVSTYNQRWREMESKDRVQTKHRLLKEEIVMKAWHPHRVERWIELGVDLENL